MRDRAHELLGAVVEPDLAELVLWFAFSALVGLLGMYAGLAKDRLEYMAHLPELPSRASFARITIRLMLIEHGAMLSHWV